MEETKFETIYEGEYIISELIKRNSGCHAHFDYIPLYDGGTNITLKIITYNPVGKTHSFMLEYPGFNQLDSLQNMYKHLCLDMDTGSK